MSSPGDRRSCDKCAALKAPVGSNSTSPRAIDPPVASKASWSMTVPCGVVLRLKVALAGRPTGFTRPGSTSSRLARVKSSSTCAGAGGTSLTPKGAATLTPIRPLRPAPKLKPMRPRPASSSWNAMVASVLPAGGLRISSVAGEPNKRPEPVARRPEASTFTASVPCSSFSLPTSLSMLRLVTVLAT